MAEVILPEKTYYTVPVKFAVTDDSETIRSIEDWCKYNCTKEWKRGKAYVGLDYWSAHFHFVEKSEAALFKLFWNEI
jgi:hypothetical protein